MSDCNLYERLCQRVSKRKTTSTTRPFSEQAVQAGADRLAYDIAFARIALKTLLASSTKTTSK